MTDINLQLKAEDLNLLADLAADMAVDKLFKSFISKAVANQSPKVGQPWPGQGGTYAGVIRDGNRLWHLILATTSESIIKAEWGGYENEVEGEFSFVDGQANTQLLRNSAYDHPVAEQIAALTIDGHSDYYLPAQKESNLLYINLPEHLSKERHWSSTQYSAGYAWGQDFVDGNQGIGGKCTTLAARALRRILIIE